MKAATKRALGLLAAILLVVAAAVVTSVWVIPVFQSVQDLRGQLLGKSDLYQNQSQASTQVQNLLAQYQSANQLQQALSLALPLKESVDDIVNQIDTITRLNGLVTGEEGLDYLPIQQPKKASLVKGVGVLRINLKLIGPYASFKKTLEALETNIRVMDLDTLKMDPAGKPGDDLFVYNLTVDTYYQLP